MSKYSDALAAISVLLENAHDAETVEDMRVFTEQAKEINDKLFSVMDDSEPVAEDTHSQEIYTEAVDVIDRLLTLANLCESCEESDKYIKIATELQKEIDDIPEETPVKQDEYPEEVNGGEGKPEDYLEDIKDLVDGDEEAIKLLTQDPNTLTIG